MNKAHQEFLPFHAINEFMRPDYRQDVIRQVLQSFQQLPDSTRGRLGKQLKQAVSVPGFRNSLQAPVPVRLRPTVSAFEKQPALTAAVLSAWTELHTDLRTQVFSLLTDRQWELLPIEADRTQLPGFFTSWPENENFDAIYQTFTETYPDDTANLDDVSLMTVWLSVCLPYNTGEDSAQES